MSQMTDYLEKKLLDHTLGKAAYTMPTTVYLALFISDPGDTGSQVGEVSASSTGYARQPITSVMSATGATSGQSTNGSAITFGPATVDWGTVTHTAVLDASSGGNMLLYGPLSSVRTIQSGDSLQYATSQFSITFA
jgi:hypothetical protein